MEIMSTRTRLAAALSVSALALVGLAGCGEEEPTRPSSADTTEASDPATSDATDEPSPDAPATTTVPVYFVGDTPQGPRLYREFRQVESDNPAAEALALMTAGGALDPDYRSLYPEGQFADVEITDSAITVVLPDESWSLPVEGQSDEEARLAAQQLAYTLQGVAQARTPITVTLDGQPADLFGLGGELSNEPELDVRALVNVTAPAEGAEVGDTFTAEGVSSSFEATTPWEVRDADGTVVKEGFATAEGWMDKLYPWTTEVDVSDLPAGQYTFVARTDDPSDGEGAGPTEDSKTIIVS